MINALAIIMGLLGTIALSETMSFELEKTAYGNSMNAFLFLVFTVIILRYVYTHICLKDKRGMVYAVVYSVGLSFALTAGKQLHTMENFMMGSIMSWTQIFLLTAFFVGPVLFLFQYVAKNIDGGNWDFSGSDNGAEKKKIGKSFFLIWMIIFLCWIPVFLAFYPGAFVYDALDEYVQVATRNFTTHHPLTHVLLLGGSVCFGNKVWGSYNAGIALYTIFQMVVVSGVFAYTVTWSRRYFSNKVCGGIVLFYGLFPLFPMYAVCSAKDTLFNAAFLLMLVQMIKLLEGILDSKGTGASMVNAGTVCKDKILFVMASVAMMLLRNNGKMAYLAVIAGIVLFTLIQWKRERRLMQLIILMLLSVVLYTGVDKTLAFVTHAREGGKQEMLTVPIQQLARTYVYSPEVFSDEEKEMLFTYIPEAVLKMYDADLSDVVKINFNNQKFKEKPTEFLGLWMQIFVKEPVSYLNAWFMTSYGYWYPDTIINVYGGQERFTFQYKESSYFGFETEPPGERDSKLPWLEEVYRKMSLELYQQNVPGISMMFSPGFLFWMFLGCALIGLYRKRYIWVLPMASIFSLWGTVILGPTFLVRYVLILWFALPIMVLAAVTPKESVAK